MVTVSPLHHLELLPSYVECVCSEGANGLLRGFRRSVLVFYRFNLPDEQTSLAERAATDLLEVGVMLQ